MSTQYELPPMDEATHTAVKDYVLTLASELAAGPHPFRMAIGHVMAGDPDAFVQLILATVEGIVGSKTVPVIKEVLRGNSL